MHVFYKKLLFYTFAAVLIFPVGMAHAGLYRVLEQENNNEFTKAYQSKTMPNLWLMHIPHVASYAYNASSVRFYIRPEGGQKTYYVNILPRLLGLPTAKAKRANIAGLDVLGYSDLHQWQISVAGELCGVVLTSHKASEDFHLNFSDQVRISHGLREAFSQPVNPNKCQDFTLPYTLGRLMGYGLVLEGKGLKAQVKSDTCEEALPQDYLNDEDIRNAPPLDDEGRLALLLNTLSEEEAAIITPQLKNTPPSEGLTLLKAFQKNLILKQNNPTP